MWFGKNNVLLFSFFHIYYLLKYWKAYRSMNSTAFYRDPLKCIIETLLTFASHIYINNRLSKFHGDLVAYIKRWLAAGLGRNSQSVDRLAQWTEREDWRSGSCTAKRWHFLFTFIFVSKRPIEIFHIIFVLIWFSYYFLAQS